MFHSLNVLSNHDKFYLLNHAFQLNTRHRLTNELIV
ncbi:unnamed protein product [Schistosoma mattheei]|uniref:Uncharacterized protein n=1 Tax=Schistosoma mattheei TaxID=31246 RepID=A0A3P8DPC6_9TREM|nr:unnamed protein product [Schistosoma mattheei]